jgi:hypothetical protein
MEPPRPDSTRCATIVVFAVACVKNVTWRGWLACPEQSIYDVTFLKRGGFTVAQVGVVGA